jgi:hypothetical protein
MTRIGRIAGVLTLLGISAHNAIAGSRSHRAAVERALGHGVSLSIDESHVERAPRAEGLIETRLTLSNYGAMPLKIDYFTFSLSGAAGERSLALLPSELHGQVASPILLRGGVLPAGQRLVAVLYFRSLSPTSRPVDVRVDLVTADGQAASRSFLPLALE